MPELTDSFWTLDSEGLLAEVKSGRHGLSSAEATKRFGGGAPHVRTKRGHGAVWLLLGQFKSPITMILILAALLSFFLHDRVDAIIILTIILISALLGFWQEYGAANALQKLLFQVTPRTTGESRPVVGSIQDDFVKNVVFSLNGETLAVSS